MSYNFSKDKSFGSFFFANPDQSSKERQEEILSEKLLVVSGHSIFKDKKIYFAAISILTYFGEFLKLDPHFQGSTASYVFAANLQPNFKNKKHDRDVIFFAQNKDQVDLLTVAVKYFVINQVLPSLKMNINKVTENQIVTSFLANIKTGPDYCNIPLGNALDLTITLKSYRETYRSIFDSIKWNVFKTNDAFTIASEDKNNVKIILKALDNGVMIYSIEKLKETSHSSFFYYFWIITQGYEVDDTCLSFLCKKLFESLEISNWFAKGLEDYMEKHIGHEEASLIFLTNISFFVNAYGHEFSDKKVHKILSLINNQISLVLNKQKIKNTKFSYALAELLIDSKIDINCLHDDLVYSSALYVSYQNSNDRLFDTRARSELSNEISLEERNTRFLIEISHQFGRLFVVLMKKSVKEINWNSVRSFSLLSKDCWSEKEFEQLEKLKSVDETARKIKLAMTLLPPGYFREVYIPINIDLKKVLKQWDPIFCELTKSGIMALNKTPYIIVCQKILYLVNALTIDQELLNRFQKNYVELLVQDLGSSKKNSLDGYSLPFLSSNKLACMVLIQLADILSGKEDRFEVGQKVLRYISSIPSEWNEEKKNRLSHCLSSLMKDDIIENQNSFSHVIYLIKILNLFSKTNLTQSKKTSQCVLNAICYAADQLLQKDDNLLKEQFSFLIIFYKTHFSNAHAENKLTLLKLQLKLHLKNFQYQEVLKTLLENNGVLPFDIQLLPLLLNHNIKDRSSCMQVMTLAVESLKRNPEVFKVFIELWADWKGEESERVTILDSLLRTIQCDHIKWQSNLFLLLEWLALQISIISKIGKDSQANCINLFHQISSNDQISSIRNLKIIARLLEGFASPIGNKTLIATSYFQLLIKSCDLDDFSFAAKMYECAIKFTPLSSMNRKSRDQFILRLMKWLKNESKNINSETVESWAAVIQDIQELIPLDQKEELIAIWLNSDSLTLFKYALMVVLRSKVINLSILRVCFRKGVVISEKEYVPQLIDIMIYVIKERLMFKEEDLDLFLRAVMQSKIKEESLSLYQLLFSLLIGKEDVRSLEMIKKLFDKEGVDKNLKMTLADQWIKDLIGKKPPSYDALTIALEVIKEGNSTKNSDIILDAMIQSTCKEYAIVLKNELKDHSSKPLFIRKLLDSSNKDNLYLELAEDLFKSVNHKDGTQRGDSVAIVKEVKKLFLKVRIFLKKYQLFQNVMNVKENDILLDITLVFHEIDSLIVKLKESDATHLCKEKQEIAVGVIKLFLDKKATLFEYTRIVRDFLSNFPSDDRWVLLEQLLVNLTIYKPYHQSKENTNEWMIFIETLFVAVKNYSKNQYHKSIIEHLYYLSMHVCLDSRFILQFYYEKFDSLPIKTVKDAELYIERLNSISTCFISKLDLKIVDTLILILKKFGNQIVDLTKIFNILTKLPPQENSVNLWSEKVIDLINIYSQCASRQEFSKSKVLTIHKMLLSGKKFSPIVFSGYVVAANYHSSVQLTLYRFNQIKPVIEEMLKSIFDSYLFLLDKEKSMDILALCINTLIVSQEFLPVNDITKDLRFPLFCKTVDAVHGRSIDFAVSHYLRKIMKEMIKNFNTKIKKQFESQMIISQHVCQAYLGVNNIILFDVSFDEIQIILKEVRNSPGYQKFVLNPEGDRDLQYKCIQFFELCSIAIINNFVRLNMATYSEVTERNDQFQLFQDLCRPDVALTEKKSESMSKNEIIKIVKSQLSDLEIPVLESKYILSDSKYEAMDKKIRDFLLEQELEIHKIKQLNQFSTHEIYDSILLLNSVAHNLKLNVHNTVMRKEDCNKLIEDLIEKAKKYLESIEKFGIYNSEIFCSSIYIDICAATLRLNSKDSDVAMKYIEKIKFNSESFTDTTHLNFRMLLKKLYLSEDQQKRNFAKNILHSNMVKRFGLDEQSVMHIVVYTVDGLLESHHSGNPQACIDALKLIYYYINGYIFKEESLFLFTILRNLERTLQRDISVYDQKVANWLGMIFCCSQVILIKDRICGNRIIDIEEQEIQKSLQITQFMKSFTSKYKPLRGINVKPDIAEFGQLYDEIYLSLIEFKLILSNDRELIMNVLQASQEIFSSCLNIPHIFDKTSFQRQLDEIFLECKRK